MKTRKLYLPVVRTLEITKINDFIHHFNQAGYTWYCVCCLFFGSQFRLVNYSDLEIVRSLSAYFGKTRSEIGYTDCVILFIISRNISNINHPNPVFAKTSEELLGSCPTV